MADEEQKQEEITTEAAAETVAAAPAPAKEEKKEEKKVDTAKLSANAKKVVEMVGEMSVLDLAELVKVMEDKFGVSAAAPVTAGSSAGQQNGGAAVAPADEKTSFNINVTSAGGNKIGVIKAIREVTTLGLKEAKDMVDALPKVIKEGVKKAEAEEIKKKLEAAGATVELQ